MVTPQPAAPESMRLRGRIFLTGGIRLKTGLHIGDKGSTLSIGGVENTVVRDPLTNRPYIPGSSLRGKLRSLSEKYAGLRKNYPKGNEVQFHVCDDRAAYENCPVCPVFGVPGEKESSAPTRLVVRDVRLTRRSAERLQDLRTDLPFTEVKWEVAIDRVTSAANPRQMERVPAGAVFGPFELVYSLYYPADIDRFQTVLEALQLLEDDYLGGQGARGSGQIHFVSLRLAIKKQGDYGTRGRQRQELAQGKTLDELLAADVDLAAQFSFAPDEG